MKVSYLFRNVWASIATSVVVVLAWIGCLMLIGAFAAVVVYVVTGSFNATLNFLK